MLKLIKPICSFLSYHQHLLDIQIPEHEDGPRDAGAPRGRARWRRRPVAAFGHGPAVPDARLQARARADGGRPVHVPQGKLPRQREGRELLLDGQDRALLRLGGRRPRYLREGLGEVYRLVQQRAHQETPERKQPSRVQTRPGRLIHFFCRSGNGVLCIDSAQFHCIDVVGMDFQL